MMTAAYASKFHSRLNRFRVDGEFTDVTVECKDGSGSFRCHRVVLASASDFFMVMFRSSFTERDAHYIPVGGVSTTILQEVLQFIYTGDAKINPDSFLDMFRASEFFQISDLQDQCISFLSSEKRAFTVNHFLEIYLYAYENRKDQLTRILIPHLAAQFELFSKTDAFLKVPFDALNELVVDRLSWSALLPNSDEIVLAAITRWVLTDADRFQYYPTLKKFVAHSNISSQFTEFLTDSLMTNTTPSFPRFAANVSHFPVVPEIPEVKKAVNLYVKYAPEKVIRIYSIRDCSRHHNGDCHFIGEIFQNNAEQYFTTVALNDFFFYRLNYFGKTPQPTEETFFAHTSVDMKSTFPAKRPPVCFEEVNVCAMRNNIYAYHETLPSNPFRTQSTPHARTFDDQDIVRGIYAYNCEVDDWFPVPPMKRMVSYAAMTVLDDNLYLIGGRPNGMDPKQYVQAHDSRVGRWRRLPNTSHEYFRASACCLQGKICVFGGNGSNRCERYDTVAGKWESLTNLPDGTAAKSKTVSCMLRAWLFSKDNVIQADGSTVLNFQNGFNVCYDTYGLAFEWIKVSLDLKFKNPTALVDCVIFSNL